MSRLARRLLPLLVLLVILLQASSTSAGKAEFRVVFRVSGDIGFLNTTSTCMGHQVVVRGLGNRVEAGLIIEDSELILRPGPNGCMEVSNVDIQSLENCIQGLLESRGINIERLVVLNESLVLDGYELSIYCGGEGAKDWREEALPAQAVVESSTEANRSSWSLRIKPVNTAWSSEGRENVSRGVERALPPLLAGLLAALATYVLVRSKI